MRPLAFASRRTTDAEKKYDAHKLEFLALRWAVVDQFAEYLSCGHFIIYTDNNPLTYIMKKKQLDAIAQRWEYDVYIVTARVHEDSPVYVIQSSRTGKVVKAHRDHMVLPMSHHHATSTLSTYYINHNMQSVSMR